jgi:uncharacterized protein (DUF1499 family)
VADKGLSNDLANGNASLLPACPDSPNCVSSLSDRPSRKVEPFAVRGSVPRSLDRLEEIVRQMPRTVIVSRDDLRLQAEFRTRLGFVDDVFFVASEDRTMIHVRSASRVGKWDLGVNRRRVERIRKKYEAAED